MCRKAWTNDMIAVIAAHLTTGKSVPEAVAMGFHFVEEMLEEGQYFE